MKQTFTLRPSPHPARQRCIEAINNAQDGMVVAISEPTRTLEQNAKFHAICANLKASGLAWAGKKRTASEWKVLLVSGHSIATKEGADMVPGLENEFVNLRESTARMNKKRIASLIEYAEAFCESNSVVTNEQTQGQP